MIDFTKSPRGAHWLPSTATIDPTTLVLTDGVPTWGVVQSPPYPVKLHFVLAYSPPDLGLNLRNEDFPRVFRIDEILCKLFDASSQQCLPAMSFSGVIGTWGFAAASAWWLSDGLFQFPAGTQVLSITFSPSSTTGTFNAFITAASKLSVDSIASTSTALTQVTPLPSVSVNGATPVANNIFTANIDNINLQPTVATVPFSGEIAGTCDTTLYNVDFVLYVAQANVGTPITWNVKQPMYQFGDQNWDFLDVVVDTYVAPIGLNFGYGGRGWSLKLPCPIIIGPGQALVATFEESDNDNSTIPFVTPYMRSRITALA